MRAYETLPQYWPGSAWCAEVAAHGAARLDQHRHGDLPRWRAALEALPAVATAARLDRDMPELGTAVADSAQLGDILMRLHPWRKGPLCLGGVAIDSEWRSDWKWRRVAPHVELEGHRVLDIGCGNGYYGWRMLAAGARLVLGVDPTLVFVMQWLACRHFAGPLPNYVLPLAAEELPPGRPGFDAVFSMGVLYHRREPGEHLATLRRCLRPAGQLVLESLVLPAGREDEVLEPCGRYARMGNVHAVPGAKRLRHWLEAAGFGDVRVVDVSPTTPSEQRQTPWMRFESLAQALDPADPKRTVEGHPAPVRAVLVARA